MDETIKKQVYTVLDKYDKNFNYDSVFSNLRSWQDNKGWLVDLLRHHPNWNEEALAVAFNVTHNREINKNTVDLHRCELSRLMTDLDIPEDDRMKFNRSINATVFTYSKILPSADTVALVKEQCGVTCSVGQKTSRIINAICKKYGLDKHPEYNARFAKLADSLNPLQVKRTALLSVHPCDYLEMSNQDNSWSSCHCLNNGEFHAGTLSYMNDECSMIFYTVDDDVTEEFHEAPKRTRQVFCFHNGILLQSRLYPQTDDDESRDMYRNIVQRTIADCLMVPNLWTLKREQDSIKHHVRSHANALNYRDYEYDDYKPNISLLRSANVDNDDYILIGHTAYCLDCAEPNYENDSLYCDRCANDDDVTCYECNREVYEDDAHYINGQWYCDECSSYCSHCEEYTTDESTEVHSSNGYSFSVCQTCLENYDYCKSCDEYFHHNMGHSLNDTFHCNDCFERYYCTCVNCREDMRKDDAEMIDDKYYCESCADNLRPEIAEDADNTAA